MLCAVGECDFAVGLRHLAAEELPCMAYEHEGVGNRDSGAVYYEQGAFGQAEGCHFVGVQAHKVGCRRVAYQEAVEVYALFLVALRGAGKAGGFSFHCHKVIILYICIVYKNRAMSFSLQLINTSKFITIRGFSKTNRVLQRAI